MVAVTKVIHIENLKITCIEALKIHSAKVLIQIALLLLCRFPDIFFSCEVYRSLYENVLVPITTGCCCCHVFHSIRILYCSKLFGCAAGFAQADCVCMCVRMSFPKEEQERNVLCVSMFICIAEFGVRVCGDHF